jgi:hypothetical protein
LRRSTLIRLNWVSGVSGAEVVEGEADALLPETGQALRDFAVAATEHHAFRDLELEASGTDARFAERVADLGREVVGPELRRGDVQRDPPGRDPLALPGRDLRESAL